MRILIVEDDAALASFIRKGLEAEHHAVDVAHEGNQGRAMAMEFDYDLVVLDLNLPGVDGLSVLKSLRQRKANLPVMILTARSRVEDRVQCLDSGADDYLVKPFSYLELSARAGVVAAKPPPIRIGSHCPRSLFGSRAAQSGACRTTH
jgi:two-component system copper resistance phosphate regulon response regulator CusR